MKFYTRCAGPPAHSSPGSSYQRLIDFLSRRHHQVHSGSVRLRKVSSMGSTESRHFHKNVCPTTNCSRNARPRNVRSKTQTESQLGPNMLPKCSQHYHKMVPTWITWWPSRPTRVDQLRKSQLKPHTFRASTRL